MSRARRFLAFALFASALPLASCGGGGSSSSTVGTPPPSSTPNVQAIQVNAGPAAAYYTSVNSAFTSVTLCVPGTSTCQTINGILVDTGSEGLRVLSSALTLSLPQQTQSGNPVGECYPFASFVTWGSVETADVEMASEKASSVPVQVIAGGTGSVSSASALSSCENYFGVLSEENLQSLGANGILGIGTFAQDCGPGCTSEYPISSGQNAELYYSCPSSGCTPTTESLTAQVVNPVVDFSTDNNGVVIELPALPTGPPPVASTVNGSLIFGIGTQSNNALPSSATVLQVDASCGYFAVTFPATGANSVLYEGACGTGTGAGLLDTGTNVLSFADPTTTGMTYDSNTGLYTPGGGNALGDTSFSATNGGFNGTSSTFNFTVEDGDYLLNNYPNDAAYGDLASPSTTTPGPSSADFFDWGLPFFYGRNVYVAIAGQTAPVASTPYFAY